jgi:Holliday junction resolvase RusA-like endonuclease
MQKLYEDCLQGIVIDNDRYSSEITSRRYYSEKPGVCIRVKKINEFEKLGDDPPKEGWIKV